MPTMQKRQYGSFRLGRRGRRGRSLRDARWTDSMLAHMRSQKRTGIRSDGLTAQVEAEIGAEGDFLLSNQYLLQSPSTLSEPLAPRVAETSVPENQANLNTYRQEPGPFLPEYDIEGTPLPEHDIEDVYSDMPLEDATVGVGDTSQPGNTTENDNSAHRDSNQFGSERLFTTEEIKSDWKRICCWQNLLALALLHGSRHLSVQQYDLVHVLINFFMTVCFPQEAPLPSASTVRRSILPLMQKWGTIDSELRTVRPDLTRRGAFLNTPSQVGEVGEEDSSATADSVFFFSKPSAWSRSDVSFKPTWNILKHSALSALSPKDLPVFSHIESAPMVADTNRVIDVCTEILSTKLPADERPSPALLSTRDTEPRLTLHFTSAPHFLDIVERSGDTGCFELQVSSVGSVLVRQDLSSPESNRSRLVASMEELFSPHFAPIRFSYNGLWNAGDVCTVLKEEVDNDRVLILVQQHTMRAGYAQKMELLCLPFSKIEANTVHCMIDFGLVERATVDDVTVTSTRNRPKSPPVKPSFGRLIDGRLYFVDNILLYSDGFSQYNFRQGSAGGVYALSLNYPPALRRSRERIRVIALTPPGVSTAEGLRALIDDIVKSCTEGVEVINADGDSMLLFTNVVGYVADYHETAHVLDISGQNGIAPCHLCAFLRYQGHASTASKYGFSTAIHSADTCYARTGARTASIRQSNFTDAELKNIGLRPLNDAVTSISPLHELSMRIEAALAQKSIPLNSEHEPVLNPKFDPYRSVLVSPDHVLFGVTVNALNFAFHSLPSTDLRKQVDILIVRSLRQNGLAKEDHIFNFNQSTVHAASISTRFSTLLLSPEVFREALGDFVVRNENHSYSFATIASLEILGKLRDLVSETYWFPKQSVDGVAAVSRFNSNGGRAHHQKLEALCEDYINSLNNACKRFPDARSDLDKQNVHRVLELYRHSIPAMGHVQHFAELIFEAAHQPLKQAMLKSNFRDSHVQSSRSCVIDEWKRRLQSVMAWESPLQEDNHEKKKELVNVLCAGRHHLVESIMSDNSLFERAGFLLNSPALKCYMQSSVTPLNNTTSSHVWKFSHAIDTSKPSQDLACMFDVISQIAQDFLVMEGNATMKIYERASRVLQTHIGDHQASRKPKPHDILTRGTVVQVWIEDEHSMVLRPSTHHIADTSPTLHHYAVELFLAFNDQTYRRMNCDLQIYAAVRQCSVSQGNHLKLRRNTPIQLLQLTDSVRRCGLVHACGNDDTMSCFGNGVGSQTCRATVLNGQLFHLYGRQQGFPPRLA